MVIHYKIVIASTNEGKIREIHKILQELPGLKMDVGSLKDYNIPEPDEPHHSFMENAIHKAKYYAQHTNLPTLSEDSGLSIEALDGFPGVKTKDFSYECGGMAKTFIKLAEMLRDASNYAACFNSAAVLYIPSRDYLITHEAKDDGILTFPPRGDEGFAYDPIFVPKGHDKTFAELGLEIKNKISHRAQAMQGLIEKFRQYSKDI
ncbi:MAG TPA: non-canonical purine NTP pyrophosphatase [Gammaproteobacteria bacterium]|nr:non-canonical purine NTP pyrophosphatase [Gammaproteobacteria bacterium]